jgi:hypothetical protein
MASTGVGVILTPGVATPMTPELIGERIADALARAEKVACQPAGQRCYPLPRFGRGCPRQLHAQGPVPYRMDHLQRWARQLGRLARPRDRRGPLAAPGGLRRHTP